MEIKINTIIQIIYKNLIIFLSIIIFSILIGITYILFFTQSKYVSHGSIMIQVQSNEGNTNTTESQRLVQSTVDILTKMNLIPEETTKRLILNGYNITVENIRSNMTVSSSSNSLVITISYISANKEETKIILDEIINTLIMVTNDEKYNMDKTLKNNISKLYVSDAYYHSPNKSLLVLLSAVLGIIASFIILFTKEFINNGYKEKDEIEEELKIQVLGVIPNFEVKRGNE